MPVQLNVGQPKVDLDGNILDVEVPKEMEKAISTGHSHIDLLYAGDGVIPSTVSLITGLPGAGKSTLMFQLADAITSKGHICLYNMGEESLYQVRRVAKRLNLKNGFIPSYHTSVDEITEHLNSLKKKYKKKQVFLIQDSLQCISPSRIDPDTGKKKKGRPPKGLKAQVEACTQLTEFVKENFLIMFMVGHVNKKGEFAGKQEIKHILDAHLHLGIDLDRRSETYQQRVAEMLKNRFGTAGLYYSFDLSEKGLQFESTTPDNFIGQRASST